MRVSKVDFVGDFLFGDEAKARIVDMICRNYRLVIRQNGGPNAGHRVKVGETSIAFHQVPSSAMSPPIACVLGSGMVIDPVKLLMEIDEIEQAGFNLKNRLFISPKAHFIFPWHQKWEAWLEGMFSGEEVGTTGRGIGPAYACSRERLTAVRVEEACFPDSLREKVDFLKNLYIKRDFFPYIEVDEFLKQCDEYFKAALRVIEIAEVEDVNDLIREVLAQEGNVLIEGAQGGMLDVDHGTYPFVTSSNTALPALLKDIGWWDRAYMAIKAYTTRVGNGPLVGELFDENAEIIRDRGNEIGETTGRPRRIAWLDTVLIRYMIRYVKTPYSEILTPVTKLDVLDTLPEIKITIAYQEQNGDPMSHVKWLRQDYLDTLEPVYRYFPGWQTDTTSCRHWDELPKEAQDYLKAIHQQTRLIIPFATVGPERSQTVVIPPEVFY